MKHFLLLLTALITVLFSIAQRPISKLPSELPEHKLPIGKSLLSKLENATTAIEFLDARPDTSKIGFISVHGGLYYKLITDKSLSEIFEKKAHSASTMHTYLFVLRKLWLKQTSAAEQQQTKIVMRSDAANQLYSQCYARIEVYEKKDSFYTPLFRLDSTFRDKNSLQATSSGLVLLPFEHCIKQVMLNPPAAQAARRKKMSFAEVKAFTFKKRLYPGHFNAAMQRGIFHSFSDFLNNKPDTTSFTLQSDPLTDELVLNKGKQHQVLNQFWGFCDGQKLFIKLGLNVFQLHAFKNTYELWGFTTAE